MVDIYRLMKGWISIWNVLAMIHNGFSPNEWHQKLLGKEDSLRNTNKTHLQFNSSISTQLVQDDRKSLLMIQGMDASLTGPYLCQTNQSVSTIILQLNSRIQCVRFRRDSNERFILERTVEMTKQIRFMATNTNQSANYGNDVRLNCFAQYYSEKVNNRE